MLQHLSITNYVIIENLELDFSNGFSVITGETGAGKSILLGALGLILGERADTSALSNKEGKCIIEGIFQINKKQYQHYFLNNDLDFESDTIIRREINSKGKSRAFINDTPVGLNVLKELGTQLVDIHSQHETLALKNNSFQLKVLDAYACVDLSNYQKLYSEFVEAKVNLEDAVELSSKKSTDFDYILFQAKEINELSLKENEKEDIEEKLKLINNSESIKTVLNYASENLSGTENSALRTLKNIVFKLSSIESFSEDYSVLHQRLNELSIELEDITSEVESKNEDFSFDPENLMYLNERVNKIYAIEQKHNLNSTQEILDFLAGLNSSLEKVENNEELIVELKGVLKQKETVLILASKEVTKKRKASVAKMEKEVINNLKDLGMPDTSFKIEVQPLASPSESGCDKVDFLFSANKGFGVQEISKAASGGELSRLMLVVKMFLAKASKVSTIIFDEIDTGVSGDIADKMAKIMSEMAHNTQVVAITHLPQVAALGAKHYRIVKNAKKGKAKTEVTLLKENERIQELAKMLSGKTLTDAAIKNAEALLLTSH